MGLDSQLRILGELYESRFYERGLWHRGPLLEVGFMSMKADTWLPVQTEDYLDKQKVPG